MVMSGHQLMRRPSLLDPNQHLKNLVVSEIMYHPSLKNEGDEFIEVMNISQTEEINLTCSKIR